MHLARPAIALDPRHFGRGRGWHTSAAQVRTSVSDDVKLFGTTFAAGFVFVSMLLA